MLMNSEEISFSKYIGQIWDEAYTVMASISVLMSNYTRGNK